MNFLRIKALNTIGALLLLLLLNFPSGAQSSAGVEISIACGGLVKMGVPNLRVTFRNLRDEKINLYLGTIGGGGARPCNLDNREITCTLNFNLSVTDASGTTRNFKFRGMDYVAGRLDPYIVHLQAYSTYTIELRIDQFWSPDTGDYKSLWLDAGKHDIFLQFEGSEPGTVNLDQPHIKQMKFWKGKLTSNTLPIDIASMDAAEQALAAEGAIGASQVVFFK